MIFATLVRKTIWPVRIAFCRLTGGHAFGPWLKLVPGALVEWRLCARCPAGEERKARYVAGYDAAAAERLYDDVVRQMREGNDGQD